MNSTLRTIYMFTLAEIEPARRSDIKKRIAQRLKIIDAEIFNSDFEEIHSLLRAQKKIIQVKKGVYVLRHLERLTLGYPETMSKIDNARFFHLKNALKRDKKKA